MSATSAAPARSFIRRWLAVGLAGSILTGAGDFLLGFAEHARVPDGLFDAICAPYLNASDAQLAAGGLLGFIGLFLEGLAFLGMSRLMAAAGSRYGRVYRVGALGYIWLAPVGCHLSCSIIGIVYKHVWALDPASAHELIGLLGWAFLAPAYVLLALFWIPMIVVQWRAFSRGLTPYPRRARWLNLFSGMVPALVLSFALGPQTAWGSAVGTMFLSCGNALTFGGLLAALPGEARFEEPRPGLGGPADA